MAGTLTINEIAKQLNTAKTEFNNFCASLPDEQFFQYPPGKWSPAQQVKHLITATKNTRLAFRLPKFIVRWYAGKPNRPSRSYDELVNKYELKLQQGGRASGPYIPKPILPEYGKKKLLEQFSAEMNKLAASIQKNWKDLQLDKYIAPHPLLGKITLRELGYFTIHHTHHHLSSIKAMTKISSPAL
jgi:hypothetical protein